MGVWDRGTHGSLLLLIAINWNRKKAKIILAADPFP